MQCTDKSLSQIAQDDEGFEIASVRDSLDFDNDDLEGGKPTTSDGGVRPPAYDAPRGSNINREASPLPAPVPQKPASLPRESLDGETIFAVGDEGEGDKWSDDEADEEERRGLTR